MYLPSATRKKLVKQAKLPSPSIGHGVKVQTSVFHPHTSLRCDIRFNRKKGRAKYMIVSKI